MAPRQTKPPISREDLLQAITGLEERLLDPDKPSLYKMVNDRFEEHADTVREVVRKFDDFKRTDYNPFKEDYYKQKNRALGYVAGAGAAGGGIFALVKHFLLGGK